MRQLRNLLQTHLAVTRNESLFVGVVATVLITGSIASRVAPWSESDLHEHTSLAAITRTLDSITREATVASSSNPLEPPAPASVGIDSGSVPTARSPQHRGKQHSSPVAINTASINDLQRIPGIGPAMAKRIVERRSQSRFTCPEDLLDVRGIGEKTLEKIRPYIVVP